MASLEFDIGMDCSPDDYVPRVMSQVSSMMSNVKSKLGGKRAYDSMNVFVILRDFLQPDTTLSLKSVLNYLVDLLPEDAPYSHEVYSLGVICVDMAEQIPYHHPSQHKMARLLEELGRSTKVNLKYHTKKGRPFFNRYQKLGEYVKDRQHRGPRDECPEEYVNLQAFLANMDQHHVFRTNPGFAIVAMHEAFETSHEDEPAGVRDALIMGAAQWILWCGHDLFIQHRYPGDKPSKEPRMYDSNEPGNSIEDFITLNTWHIWKDGFRAVAGENCETSKKCKAVLGEKYEPNAECRAIALKAADLMDAFEKNMSF